MTKLLILFSLFASMLYGEWAEKTLKSLTIQEKIGQLFVAPACPKYDEAMIEEVIDRYHLGAVIIKQGHPKEQVSFLNALQKRSKHPLLCMGDAEWGLGMRMEETLSFPKNEVLGKVKTPFLLFLAGKEIGEQCRMVGIHLNLAPVVDVNNNPENIVIGSRSFGSDPLQVAQCGYLMIWGMRHGNTLSCIKHFPGHGDTDVDSHKGLPKILHGRNHLESIEFLPFKRNLCADAVMTGHLVMPALDDTYPASLSKVVVTDLLQKGWGFNGLVITDALNMKALTQNYSVEEIAVKALLAGHDFLLYGAHRYEDIEFLLTDMIPKAYQAIACGVERGEISQEILDQHVLKILRVKEKLKLHENRLILPREDLMERLHSKEAISLIERIKKDADSTQSQPSKLLE